MIWSKKYGCFACICLVSILLILLLWTSTVKIIPPNDGDFLTVEFEIGSPMSSHNTPVNDNPNRQWLRMRDGQVVLHAYSAFYDDRETGDGPVVRIIVVAHKLDRIQLFCIYNKTSEVAIKNEMKFTASKPEIGVGWSHNGRWFREYVLFCSCNPHKIPKTVTIVTNTTNEVHEIFALQVEQPEKALVRRGYAVCPAVVHHHLNPAFIIEWLEMLNILGVNKVTVYNISLDEAGSKILHYYNNKNDNKFVELRQSPYFVSDNEDTRRLHQSPVINDCYFRNMYRYEKIIVMDLDEIITPRIQYTYAELLHNIEDSTSAKGKSDRFRSYEFRNEYYFLDLEGDTHQPDNLVTMFHRKHVKVSNPGYSVKSIHDPMTCTALHNHYCWRFGPAYNSEEHIYRVDPSLGTSQHYKKCHFTAEKCEEMMAENSSGDHMLRFKDQLTQNVKKVTSEINK